jgi:hypothetical protein
MGLMMWFMAKGMRKESKPELSVDDLRSEHRRIGDEIERLEGTRPGRERASRRRAVTDDVASH